MDEIAIRKSLPADFAALEALYPLAFPEEDLLPLVRSLLRDPEVAHSLAATVGARIVAHAIFTDCGVSGHRVRAALLGPLAVAPEWQGQGIGTAIVSAGLKQLEEDGIGLVCVLGDPGYYRRLGFQPETLVAAPFPLPAEWAGAWQSKYLVEAGRRYTGTLTVPPPWQRPALWAP